MGVVATPDGKGYWEVASDGGVFAFGDAAFYGSMGGQPLDAPVVGMAATPDGKGYWEVASDGGIFAFGDAAFAGRWAASISTRRWWAWRPPPTAGLLGGGVRRRRSSPSVTPRSTGSMGGQHAQRSPSWAWPPTPDGRGYWEVASDGGIFAFGDAAFYGLDGRPAT